jgi:hypothetical protein
MVERFNGRVQREVLGIMIYSHADLEIVPRGFNAVYNGRRQRALEGPCPSWCCADVSKLSPRSPIPPTDHPARAS